MISEMLKKFGKNNYQIYHSVFPQVSRVLRTALGQDLVLSNADFEICTSVVIEALANGSEKGLFISISLKDNLLVWSRK